MRKAGILLHISSLPDRYGIGTLGKVAYDFVDFLKETKQSYWQMLPIGPTSIGDSPYQSFSSFAGNPYFIDLTLLRLEGLLDSSDLSPYGRNQIDYNELYLTRFNLLRIASKNFFLKNKFDDYFQFCGNSPWLNDYALFMTIKGLYDGVCWLEWPLELKKRDRTSLEKIASDYEEEVAFWKFVQFSFYKQWNALKSYAEAKFIKLIGDLPIYVALDSCDVWVNPSDWLLDDKYNPILVAGCPPDYFSAEGQLWGNPIYDYKKMKANGYCWWIKRLKHQFELFDVVRIDHFRGFSGYWGIQVGEVTLAKNGKWYKGPGFGLFKEIYKSLGNVEIIAEDLGFLTSDVHKLRNQTKYPGMKILQFAFDPYNDNDYLPHNVVSNCVYYPGTHDNTTLRNWYETLDISTKNFVDDYLGIDNSINAVEKLVKAVLASVANLAIIPIQDYLNLGAEGRMNTPSTMGGNWLFRLQVNYRNEINSKIRHWTSLYRRN